MTTDKIEAPIEGLRIVRNYTEGIEQIRLLNAIDAEIWRDDLSRRVQFYGWRYDYRAHRLDSSQYLGVLPEWAANIAQKLNEDFYSPDVPDQLIVNEYLPGQGIAPHVDCVPCFADTILSLSLGSSCLMTFTAVQTDSVIEVMLYAGDLIVMQGESRYQWKHGIPARKSDTVGGVRVQRHRRVSLTFRTAIVAPLDN